MYIKHVFIGNYDDIKSEITLQYKDKLDGIFAADYIKIVLVKSNITFKLSNPNSIHCDSIIMKPMNCIFSETYDLYDPLTIKKINFKITAEYLNSVFRKGKVKVLDYLKSRLELTPALLQNVHPMYIGSATNNVNVLEWWKNSGLPIEYNENVLRYASKKAHFDVLDWWLNSGLPLIYDEDILDYLLILRDWWDDSKRLDNAEIDLLNWWKNSGLTLKYSNRALLNASRCSQYNNINVLNWWKNSGLPLKYDINTFYAVSSQCSTGVLEWWKNSGIKLKISCRNIALNDFQYKYHVCDWWFEENT
jgi:hypothetical protein